MALGPTEEDRLLVFTAAELARRTLERGLALNAPEATALICDEMHMAARAGGTYEAVGAAGRAAVRADQLLPGVADLLGEIRVEVLLDEGTRLIVLRGPWA
jgi:urease subunit gamma/beta